jgi:hypothetical protein
MAKIAIELARVAVYSVYIISFIAGKNVITKALSFERAVERPLLSARLKIILLLWSVAALAFSGPVDGLFVLRSVFSCANKGLAATLKDGVLPALTTQCTGL